MRLRENVRWGAVGSVIDAEANGEEDSEGEGKGGGNNEVVNSCARAQMGVAFTRDFL